MQGLEQLLAEGIIDEVHNRLKTGKEAEVYLVTHKGEVVAAKVYKEREHRSFKNNAGYTEGRQVRNTRTQRAMDKGSRFGKHMAEEAWKQAEADALYKLHAAGARVPKPVLFYEGVLLMEALPDAAGNPAPRLIDAGVLPEQAAPMYALLRSEVVKLLCADLIHGDLSPYNVLVAWDGPVIIDFPQVIVAARNNRAEQFFKRDLDNLWRFFAALDPALSGRAGDSEEIWRAYVKRELSPEFVPTGRVAPAQGRQGGRPDGRPQGNRSGPRGDGRQAEFRSGRPEEGRGPRGEVRGGDGRGPRPAQGGGARGEVRGGDGRGSRPGQAGGPRREGGQAEGRAGEPGAGPRGGPPARQGEQRPRGPQVEYRGSGPGRPRR